ncbi:cytochrome d ubiquinol oxidase subunit II [Salinibacterium sp. SYSU T00001]|uniref:cytochrome d ubiquinol oxidase subunit II n=1 Tax=Homoserinimonas sedimenticola TaxID=2986805 RepID=UPI00223665AA|nr:cytochrome d ubiquinol oxidase subunit II [Salinibacterium sedimenticola]MCW4384388.1 cytochrome d ubiquinol oxidase subunit II [Salinibacterium sedimenticola]
MEFLPTLWFVLIAVLWIGYLFLEGFDLGVGMHLLFSARSERERRVMLNTIGPVWDGNEVWLLTAGGATFAAFPFWYASLFSALYIPLVIVLLGLIFRAVAIEYRGKGSTDAWIRSWDFALGLGSLVSAFGVGAALALTTTGLPLNENGDRVGGAWAWFNGYAVLGGLAVVGFCLVHAAAFLALKTEGPVRERSRRFVSLALPVALLPLAAWVLVIQFRSGTLVTWALVLVAVTAAVVAWFANRAGREGWSFIGLGVFLVTGAAALFGAVYPIVLPSTLDPAHSLTIWNASSSDYTLGVMSIVAAVGVPLVLVYQGWTYWVFRKRVTAASIPEAHAVMPAVRSR